ncbi:MAG: hypothetical protein E6K48_00145 [Gammaproteobacteria bacterium]|nr:MAG: hypothetical protein E6K48_00145 [Gammaproteobacteria bacterium]
MGRFEDPRIAESVSALLPHLARRGVEVLVSEHNPPGVPGADVTRVADAELGARTDLLIAIGGDGTRRTCCSGWMRRSRASWRPTGGSC